MSSESIRRSSVAILALPLVSLVTALVLLSVVPNDVAFAAAEPPTVFSVPPSGGAVQGFSGTGDPAALAAAQHFDVLSISAFDVEKQRFYVYIPGAPGLVNTLTRATLSPNSIVWVRRDPTDTRFIAQPPEGSGLPPVVFDPGVLPLPRPGGSTQGLAGASEPSALVDAFRQM